MRLKPGQTVTIAVNNPVIELLGTLEQQQNYADTPSGIDTRRRESEMLYRRDSDILLEFYDLGMRKNLGIFSTLPFYKVPDLDISSGVPEGELDFGIEGHNQLKSKLFEIPIEEWKNEYKRIDTEEAYEYGISLYLGNPEEILNAEQEYPIAENNKVRKISNGELLTNSKLINKGLSIKANPEFFSLLTINGFWGFGKSAYLEANDLPYKVTEINDFEADEVSLVLANSAKVYLVPTVVLQFGSEMDYDDSAFSSWFNCIFTIPKREVFLKNQEIEDFWATSGLLRLSPFAFTFGAINIPAAWNRIREYMLSFPDARYYRSEDGVTGSYESIVEYPQVVDNVISSYFTAGSYKDLTWKAEVEIGSLLAVIETAGKFYYFWSTNKVQTNKGFSFGFLSPSGGEGSEGGGGGEPEEAPIPIITLIDYNYSYVDGEPFNQTAAYVHITKGGSASPSRRQYRYSHFADFIVPPDKIRRLYYVEGEGWIPLGEGEEWPEGLPYTHKQTIVDFTYPTNGNGEITPSTYYGVYSPWEVSIPRFPVGWVTSLSGGESPDEAREQFLPNGVIYVEARDLYGSTWSDWASFTIPFTGWEYF